MEVKSKSNVSFVKNKKQEIFFKTSIESSLGKNDYRYLFYGGGIRGGKTYCSLAVLITLCKMFPNSRWAVIRQDFPSLQKTTLPSISKILGNSSNFTWSRDKGNYHCQYEPNGSRIYFFSENLQDDPELLWLLGFECNGVLLEQIEELDEKTFNMVITRIGSWYIDPMPKPLILATFNPSQCWIKQRIYEVWKSGNLKPPYYYQVALAEDNSFVTEDQWGAWNTLDERFNRQFIQGDWTNFSTDSLWAWAFNREKHLGEPEPNPEQYLKLMFDFNKNPICCVVRQDYDDTTFGLESIKLPNSDIYALCDYIKVKYPQELYTYLVTGDASGKNSSALVKDNLNYYVVIKTEFNLSDEQLLVPESNPPLADNQLLTNSLFQHRKTIIHKTKCADLIYDFENVKMLPDGSIVKANRQDPKQQADLLDCWRYGNNVWNLDYLTKRKEIISNIANESIEVPFDFNKPLE